jgi:hypothetical protein
MQLIRYEAARTALAECQRVDEVKDIRDKSMAMEAYARQAKDTGLMQMAAEIKVRAERRLGEMLREQKETVGLAQGRRSDLVVNNDEVRTPTLSEIGISRDLSSRSQQLAAMPEHHFETAIASAKETARAVSTTYMLRLGEEASKNDALRADIERLQRDNAYKRVITAFEDAAHWLRIAEQDGAAPLEDQREKLHYLLDTINRLAAATLGEVHENH